MVWWVYPETVGKTLEEIAALFGDEVAVDIQEAHHFPDTDTRSDEKIASEVTEAERVEDIGKDHHDSK